MLSRTRLKALLARLDPERLRGMALARRIRRLPVEAFASQEGRLPLRPGLRDVVLGRRSLRASAGPVAYHADKLDAVLRRYRIGADARIVEVGCHTGALLDRLAARGQRRLSGVDYAHYHGHDLATAVTPGGVEIDNRGFAEAELDGCDLVYSFDTFEHLGDWPLFLQRVLEGLAPGGIGYVHYNPYMGINGAHSAGTVDVPWGHVFLKPDEHLQLVRQADPPHAEENVAFVERFLNRVRLADVSEVLHGLGATFALLPRASVGDQQLFEELYRGFDPPFVSEELFVREVEIVVSRPR